MYNNTQLHPTQSKEDCVAPRPSQAERADTLCVFSDQFNGVETVAMPGIPLNTAMTSSDGRNYKIVGEDGPFLTHWADPAVRPADQQHHKPTK